jgi:hypothetical protein
MFSHVSRLASRVGLVPFVAGVLLVWECHASAQKPGGDLPQAQEPWLAEAGDWAADFNQAQTACYEGSMRACDSIWSNERVLMDTFLYKYGRTCGGRVDLHEIVQANLTCTEAFPGHE